MTHPPEREIGRELAGAMHHSTGSYELVIAAIAAAGLGFWIDYVVGTMPIFTLIFAIAGFIGAGYSIWIKYQDQMETANEERMARRGKRSSTTGARARDERLSGAERSAPADDSVLRANATCAAEQAGKTT